MRRIIIWGRAVANATGEQIWRGKLPGAGAEKILPRHGREGFDQFIRAEVGHHSDFFRIKLADRAYIHESSDDCGAGLVTLISNNYSDAQSLLRTSFSRFHA